MLKIMVVLLMGIYSCRAFAGSVDSDLLKERKLYPKHWWQPCDLKTAPDWEILTQDAKPGEVILSKRNELGILSNFGETPFEYHGKKYQSVEGFWQMMKYPDGPEDPRMKPDKVNWSYTREKVSQMIAFPAKEAGNIGTENMKKLGIDWVTFEGKRFPYRVYNKNGEHCKIINEVLRAKIAQNPKARAALLSTGNLILKPDHKEVNPPPAWKYYDIYMDIRKEYQDKAKLEDKK